MKKYDPFAGTTLPQEILSAKEMNEEFAAIWDDDPFAQTQGRILRKPPHESYVEWYFRKEKARGAKIYNDAFNADQRREEAERIAKATKDLCRN